MRRTKENELRVIKAMQANADELYRVEKERGNKETAERYLRESMIYDRVIWVLTKKSYFDRLCDLFQIQ